MHPDNKLASHGKTGNSSGVPPQHHNVSQSPACSLGTKGVGAGNHGGSGGKVSQPAPGGGNSGLKTSQAPGPPFGGLKGKAKRERSVSVDSGERREASATSLDKEPKGEVAPRSKRRCVLERKQPYSGDEWCSGPESEEEEEEEEEEEKPLLSSTHNCNVAEPAMTTGSQLGPGSNPLPSLSETGTSGTTHHAAPGLRSDAGNSSGGKQALQFVYVFTTHLANTAAEAVLQGRADSILGYHQQHVPRAKLDQQPPIPKIQAVPEPLHINSSPASTPQSQPAMAPSSQAPGPPTTPATPSQPGAPPQLGLGQGPLPPPPTNALPLEPPPEDPCRDLTPGSMGNGSISTAPSSAHSDTPTAPPPSALPAGTGDGLLGEGASTGPPSAGSGPRNALGAEGLSKEQLEHRERSLQTLRDIERLLLRSSESEAFLKGGPGPGEGGGLPPPAPPPQPSQAPPPGPGLKKYEEPLQSMISQTQSLGGPGLDPDGGPVTPGVDMGQQMNMMMQRLGQDSLTPEQVAWRKLQEEYYEEKRRKEEQVGLHGGRPPLQDMMLPQPIGGMMLRGPPPPYHSKPGEQWLLRGVPVEMQEQLQLRPAFGAPRFAGGQIQRGFGGMQSLSLDSLGPLGSMQRPVRPGLAWSEEMALGGPGGFAPGNLPYPAGQGEAERFLATPRAREELLRHQLLEKRPGGMQRPLALEMERLMPTHRQVDPALFAGEGLGLEFGGSRAMLSPPLRDLEPALGPPGNLNMNMNVNMNMNMNLNVQMSPQQQQQQQQQQQMLLSQKMRGPELLPSEELGRVRAPNGSGAMVGGPQKMMMGSPFSSQGGQPQGPPAPQGFPSVQGPFPPVPQEAGNTLETFAPAEQGGLGGTTRLSHVPPPTPTPASLHQAPVRGLGRRPSDLALNMGQTNSPTVGRLKSPTLGQVHSPLGNSPSASLKSPRTPSAMVNLPAASGPLKSPQVLGSVLSVRSPTSSPGHLTSPPMAVASPGWAPSPKNALPSPGIVQSKPALGLSSSAPLTNMEQGPMAPGPRSSSSAPPSNPSGPLNPNLPFPSSPDAPPSQNPLSLMMSQMSKYAMPSSTPLYHNAIKTIATSDDELLPDRPMLPPGAMPGMVSNPPNQMHLNSVGPPPAQSPMAMNLPGQQPLSHEPPGPPLSSPSALGPNIPLHGNAGPPNPMMLPPGAQDSLGQPCGPPGQLVFPSRLQQPPANGGSLPLVHGGASGGPGMQQQQQQQHYPPGLGIPPEDLQAPPPPPGQMPPQQQHHHHHHQQHHHHHQQQQQQQQQRMAGRLPEPYPSVLPGVASVLSDPELSDVIRPTPTGIPEFDLSRIIPSEKPSSTLQYFPKGEGQAAKAQPPSNLHLLNLQNMMAEQAPARPGPQGMQRGMGMCHPSQVPMLGRTGLAPQQAMVGNSLAQGLMLPQQNLMAQPNFLLMQAKQRSMSMPGEMYAQPPGHLMPPQGSLMGPPPQQNLMLSHPLRQRSVSLDGQMTYGPGAGGMANLPF